MNYSAELNTRKNQALYQFRTSLVFEKFLNIEWSLKSTGIFC